MRAILIIVSCIIIVFSYLSTIPESFAEGFEHPVYKLPHNPTICAFEPKDTRFQNLGQKMLLESEYAVSDWQAKLGQGKHKNSPWAMTLVKVPISQVAGYDTTKCDITISFQPEPTDPNAKFLEAGVTSFSKIPQQARIIIYYLGVNIDSKETTWSDGNYIYHRITYTPYYTGYLATDPQLKETIRHEIGHALGLGHYIVDDNTLQQIAIGKQDSPSIMVTNVMTYGVTHFSITPVDVSEVKSIYNYQGFGPVETQPDYSMTADTQPNQYTIKTDRTRYMVGYPITISGYLYAFNSDAKGMVYVLNPAHDIIDQFDVSSKTSNAFSIPVDVSNYTMTGNYTVELVAGQGGGTVATAKFTITRVGSEIPAWIKNNALWWSQNVVSDDEFVKSIQYLIQQGILVIPQTENTVSASSMVPTWVKTNAGWWAKGAISDDEFVRAIQYLISSGIIQV